jgi:hypothetical protein
MQHMIPEMIIISLLQNVAKKFAITLFPMQENILIPNERRVINHRELLDAKMTPGLFGDIKLERLTGCDPRDVYSKEHALKIPVTAINYGRYQWQP